jgi:predicted dehydrogenase
VTELTAAVIGLGSMGANHARVLADLPGVRLVGVCDADPARAESIGLRYGTPAFIDLERLLATSPDLVSVVVPTGLHEAVASAALAAGASVLVEKPIAGDMPSARRIAAAVRPPAILTVGHIERFNPAVRELKQRLDQGQGGAVLQLQARRVGPFPHRIRDVGVIHDLAPHDIDIMRYLLGDEVGRVYADARGHINTDNEDLFLGLLHFERGALGVLDINWLTPTKQRSLTALCERGMFVVDYAAQSLTFYENYAAVAREGAIASVTEGPMTRYPIAFVEPLRLELEAFRDAVLAGGPAPVSAEDGIAALAVSEALVQSAAQGRPVPVASHVAGR